jgi:hypothetical protein
MIEPFGDLIPRKRFREGVSSLRGIQDALGDLNDSDVNRELVLAYAREVLAGDRNDCSDFLIAFVQQMPGVGLPQFGWSTVGLIAQQGGENLLRRDLGFA